MITWTWLPPGSYPAQIMVTGTTQAPLCPDLLRWEQIGQADRWRGQVVRGFFWLLRAWPA